VGEGGGGVRVVGGGSVNTAWEARELEGAAPGLEQPARLLARINPKTRRRREMEAISGERGLEAQQLEE
jgi:hypothetical protein